MKPDTIQFAGLPAGYEGNLLIEACGPILDRAQILQKLLYLPPLPTESQDVPQFMLEHHLMSLLRMHIPTPEGIRLVQSIDLMLRQGYVHRRPTDAPTWRRMYEPDLSDLEHAAVQLGGTLGGLSGVGKTTAIERALSLFPQVVTHSKFPGLMNEVRQLVWLKVDVPPSGRLLDLVKSLVAATDKALGQDRCAGLLSGRERSGSALAFEWLGRVSCNFPGILVLDEVQNLFKIETKAVRGAARRQSAERPPLRIVDDEALKTILVLSNRSKIPTLLCATPDGMNALSTRLSTAQRLMTAGHHEMPRYTSADDPFFSQTLLPKLWSYQWLARRMPLREHLRQRLHELSGGVLRICLALWIHAQRRAIARCSDEMSLADLEHAAEHALAPVRPAVRALLSNDPRAQLQYEDLLPPSF